MANADGRVEALIAQARALIEEISQEGRKAVAEAEAEADRNVARHGELRDELSALRAQAEALEAEREGLPGRAYRAGLDEEYDVEDDLKARYKEAGLELAAVKERIPEAEKELAALVPNGAGNHENEVPIAQYAQVNRAAAGPLVELKRLGSEVQNAAVKASGFFEQTIQDRNAETWSWRNDANWTDEYRDRLRRSGSAPSGGGIETIKADPAKLAMRGVGNAGGTG